eukprot:6091210-Pyramimonas_sp.AAC.1
MNALGSMHPYCGRFLFPTEACYPTRGISVRGNLAGCTHDVKQPHALHRTHQGNATAACCSNGSARDIYSHGCCCGGIGIVRVYLSRPSCPDLLRPSQVEGETDGLHASLCEV